MTSEQVLKTQRQVFYRSLLQQDWEALEGLYAENYILVRSDGSVLPKKEVLEDLRLQHLVFQSIELADEEVRMIGSAAVLTGTSVTTAVRGSEVVESHFRLVAVYVEEAGSVRLLHFQSTPIAGEIDHPPRVFSQAQSEYLRPPCNVQNSF